MAVDSLDDALRRLRGWLNEQARRHPQGHLLAPGTTVELTLRLPLDGEPALAAEVARLRAAGDAELNALIAHRAVLRDGRVIDLRSGQSDGPECEPRQPRAVFVGYAANGAPRFLDFAQWLLERKHPELDRLYARPPALVVVASGEDELYAAVLPPFRHAPADWRLHGQVVAGLYELPGPGGGPAGIALTFQLQSAAAGGHRRRFALQVLGQGPEGETLAATLGRLGRKMDYQPPWQGAVRWAQEALLTLEDALARRRVGDGNALEARLHGILDGLARRLAHNHRARASRTDHGEQRHRQGDRPTPFALRDLDEAGDGEVLVDTRAATLIVLGDRGRAHVFTPAGKLVTSIRYTPESIGRKKKQDIWRPATPLEVSRLRTAAARSASARSGAEESG